MALITTKIDTISHSALPSGSVLGAYSVSSSTGTTYSNSTGNVLLTKTITTKRANSTFLVNVSFCQGVGGGNTANLDSYDHHFYITMTPAGGATSYLDGNPGCTRTTGGAPANGKIYSTDVPFGPSRDWTYGNNHDVFFRSMNSTNSPSYAAGVSVTFTLLSWAQADVHINRCQAGVSSGGASGMHIMEIAA